MNEICYEKVMAAAGKYQVLIFVLHGAHLSIGRNLCSVIGDRLRTTYHMPCACVSFLGIPAASGGVPPNPLETDRI